MNKDRAEANIPTEIGTIPARKFCLTKPEAKLNTVKLNPVIVAKTECN